MGKLRINRGNKKIGWTILLAFLMPGFGHLYVGQYGRGLLLTAGLLLDYTAIFRLANANGGQHLLLIVYLGFLLPCFYFVSVFDAIERMNNKGAAVVSFTLVHGIWLTTAGIIMTLLVKPPTFLLPFMNRLAELSVGPLLIIAAVLMVYSSRLAKWFKLGRLTASALIVAVGSILLWDQWTESNAITALSEWWPALFILLGAEMILYQVWLRAWLPRLRLDLRGAFGALAVAVTAYAVTQYADFPVKWLDQFDVNLSGVVDYGEEKGFRFDKNVIKVPVQENLSSIVIQNKNGDVYVHSGDVEEIEVYTTVWVELEDQREAEAIADQSSVTVTPGADMKFEGDAQPFGANGTKMPKLSMEIVVPFIPLSTRDTLPDAAEQTELPSAETELPSSESDISATELPSPLPTFGPPKSEAGPAERTLKLAIESGNGSITVQDMNVEAGLSMKSVSGKMEASRIVGGIAAEGNDGSIEVTAITGKVSLETKNGMIAVQSQSGESLFAGTQNGNIELADVASDIDAETKNGKITIDEALASVKADTLNGDIAVRSSYVGGDWDLDSSVGEITLTLPSEGDFQVYGSVTFGNITSELPLEQSRKTIRGSIGEGIFHIHINATNSIFIHRNKQ
ncbi:DUF4097 family beta strand repeat-containing protein [Paenibacillus sp. HB172176]|uniref:DUF4097 family beta strand repeat-containing protein n=1 Tax=Paenibacillus sp. HB172176 TaxID=2493690 RepID=UPI00143CAF0D|nr:DUF4097 family beta strand repeat-containing protein [Paenibacillus sp. HB172176]